MSKKTQNNKKQRVKIIKSGIKHWFKTSYNMVKLLLKIWNDQIKFINLLPEFTTFFPHPILLQLQALHEGLRNYFP